MDERAAPIPDLPDHDPTDDQEIDLLDLLVVAAENVKLLVLGPLIVGLLALGGAYALPKTYQSVSVLSTDEVNPAVVGRWATSGDLLAPVLEELGLFKDKSKEEAVRRAREIVIVAVGKQDKLVTLTTQGETPDAARQLNQRMLDQLVQYSRPTGAKKTAMQFQLDTQKVSLAAAVALEKDLGNLLISGKLATEAQSRVFSDLLRSKTELVARVAQLQLQLEGLNASNVVQAPSLPERPIKPKKAVVAVSATLLSAIGLVLFVFVRQSLRKAASGSETAAKLQRIRRSLGFRN
jgi:LPS O-antigen subunit length determinant protein (WzzB/FepE family)